MERQGAGLGAARTPPRSGLIEAFEFLRDHRFNAISRFAAIGKDGKPQDDGLRRNQFGGTFGGPIVKDKLFFFVAYQGTRLRQRPSSNIEYVPTAAMMVGDFTAFASPACNAGRQVALRARGQRAAFTIRGAFQQQTG